MRSDLIEFGKSNTIDRALEDVTWKPSFTEKKTEEVIKTASKSQKLKSEFAAEKNRQNLQKTLLGSTKAVMGSFLAKPGPPMPKPNFGTLQRKREGQPNKERDSGSEYTNKKPVLITAIVE
ncbi:hypothetical protein IQ07DRAFT_606451 [Pyrenochaeta sp. DS3sAY3a]|nr:hypothetical protein IQ07DRAFT_606451 [Pyrenochaeta sp. DS3sAY3a]